MSVTRTAGSSVHPHREGTLILQHDALNYIHTQHIVPKDVQLYLSIPAFFIPVSGYAGRYVLCNW